MLRLKITYDLKCELPKTREECNGKREHCYIIRGSNKAALVWLNPILIEANSDLLDFEKEIVLTVINDNQYELEDAYRKVANGW